MKLLAIGNLDEEFAYLDRLPEVVENLNIEAILFTGNILRAEARQEEWNRAREENRQPDRQRPEILRERDNDAESFKRFFHTLSALNRPTYLVPGKQDAPERFFLQAVFNQEFVSRNIYMVHRSFAPLGRNFVVAGFGGQITDESRENEFFLMYPGWEAEFSLEFLRHLDPDKILLFHTPPGEKFEQSPEDTGSEIVSTLIKTYRPHIVVCSRESRQKGKMFIGNTLVVAPAALKEGYYAVIDTREKAVEFGDLR
ncbi:MAG: metallophosphoesterase [Calditrichaeota bacterium]|nr:MAG: metallophosphoesterase [Calditrichota bacterium]